MKKGFTLIELLIVMVIVGLLVTVALPQYRRTSERGRVTVGMEAARQIADRVNAWYIVNNNTYPTASQFDTLEAQISQEVAGIGDLFGQPTYNSTNHQITLPRNAASGWNYTVIAYLSNGELNSIECSGGDCTQLGMQTKQAIIDPGIVKPGTGDIVKPGKVDTLEELGEYEKVQLEETIKDLK